LRPEDRDTAGAAGGAALAAASAGGIAAGNSMSRKGRKQVRRNSGGRGDQVRGGRLQRAGASMSREGREGLGKFRRIETKAGPRYMDGNKFARSKQFTSMIEDAKGVSAKGRQQSAKGAKKRSRSAAGVKAIKRGRLVRAGGAAGALAGVGLTAASIASAERRQSRRSKERDAALRPVKPQEWKDTRTLSQLRPKRAPEGSRKFAEDPKTGKLVEQPTLRQRQYDEELRRRERINGR